MNLKRDLADLKRVLIIHHWDTDGICSASLLKDVLSSATVVNRTPEIGRYRLSKTILSEASQNWDAIIVADIRLPDLDFEKLTNNSNRRIILFDHHIGGTPDGVFSVKETFLDATEADFPSTSWMVKESLQLPMSVRSILGIIGDKGHLELSDPLVEKDVRRFLSERRLDEETLQKVSDLLDSNARVGDESLVEKAVSQLSENGENVQAILEDPIWTRNARDLDREIDRTMEAGNELHKGIAVKRFHSKFDIVSTVARRMARSGNYRAVVALNSGFLDDRDQLYVRKGRGSIDSKAIIGMAHKHGFSAGGKEEVVGTVLPKDETQIFLREILSAMAG